MHLTTVSALAVQIGLVAASVIAGAAPDSHDIMGLRDWRETMVASLQQAQARASELVKQHRERDTALLSSAIHNPEEEDEEEEDSTYEKRQFAGFGGDKKHDDKEHDDKKHDDKKNQGWLGGSNKNKRFFPGFGGNNENKQGQQGGGFFGGEGSWQNQAEPGKKAGEKAKQHAQQIGKAFNGGQGHQGSPVLQARHELQAAANAVPAGQAATATAAAANGNWDKNGKWVGPDDHNPANGYWDNNGNWVSPENNNNNAYGDPTPVVPEPHATAYPSSVGWKNGDHGNNGDWAAVASNAVASANSIASSYRSEYSAGWTAPAPAPPSPPPTSAGWGEGHTMPTSAGWVGEGHQPSAATPSSTALVVVNGGLSETGRIAAGVLLGAGVAAVAVALGIL